MRARQSVAVLATVVVAGVFVCAQSERLAFAAVSIKADSAPFTDGSAGFRPGGTFVATAPAASLVNMAFGGATLFQRNQIDGLPDWANVIRYNITAKVPAYDAADLSIARRSAFIRAMLEDRFALKAHITDLIGTLAGASGRPVLDQTNLTGRFDVDLRWNAGPSVTAGTDDRPSVFAAVHEQLGLRLEAGRAPMDVLVVDHIQKPTEN